MCDSYVSVDQCMFDYGVGLRCCLYFVVVLGIVGIVYLAFVAIVGAPLWAILFDLGLVGFSVLVWVYCCMVVCCLASYFCWIVLLGLLGLVCWVWCTSGGCLLC